MYLSSKQNKISVSTITEVLHIYKNWDAHNRSCIVLMCTGTKNTQHIYHPFLVNYQNVT